MVIHRNNLPGFFVSLLLVAVFSMHFGGVQTSQTTSLQDQILHSFAGSAHAESLNSSMGGDNGCYNVSFSSVLANPCLEVPESIYICLKENTSDSFLAYYYLYATNGPVSLSNANAAPTSPLTVIPAYLSSSTYLAIYDRQLYQFGVSAPAIPFVSSPTIVAANLNGDFNYPDSTYQISHNVTANIQAEHVNTAPNLSNLLPQSVNQALTSANQTVNMSVTADYSDAENNHSNVTFELTNDNFTTILQSVTLPAVASGTTVSHTFTGLGVGNYNWRVSAVETDALGNCTGYVNADPAINLSYTTANKPGGTGVIHITSGSLAPTGENTRNAALLAAGMVFAGISSLYVFFRKKLITKK
ncbi:hypothetical protein H0W80_02745 [Candidatus Saccharibacteria bacterium]|nr:hypothetical protein [Candidatus Saccharibacteria bacterium]